MHVFVNINIQQILQSFKEEKGARTVERVIPLQYIKERDALMCEKYRGVRLMEHSMKVWEKILEGRLREIVEIDENQFGFQQGKSTVDAIFVMRQLRERYG